jgi:carbamoyl-phosphate synthase large subunit
MKRILVAGAGGAPSTNFIRSLRKAKEKIYIVGADADKHYLMRSEVDKRYLVPPASDPNYFSVLNQIIKKEKVEFMHMQNDYEIGIVSENREKINTNLFLPSEETIKICQNKFLSYEKWKNAGIKIPLTMMIHTKDDLKKAFKEYNNKVWVRAIEGAAGKGSLPVTDIETAINWIDLHKGWGSFTASEMLEKTSTTWMSIWYKGELIVAQGRKRLYWEMAKVSPSGITGVTGTGLTVSDPVLDKLAVKVIKVIDKKPHGLFAVDMTYDSKGVPNPTEINIGRFFTTHQFFTEAGVNMPYIYTKLAFGEKPRLPKKKINPIKPGYLWIRGMDFEPILTTEKEVEKYVTKLERMTSKLST